MKDMTKQEWIAYFDETKEEDCSLLDMLLVKSAENYDGTEAMKFAQAAVSLTQAIGHKYEYLLKRTPKGVWDNDQKDGG